MLMMMVSSSRRRTIIVLLENLDFDGTLNVQECVPASVVLETEFDSKALFEILSVEVIESRCLPVKRRRWIAANWKTVMHSSETEMILDQRSSKYMRRLLRKW